MRRTLTLSALMAAPMATLLAALLGSTLASAAAARTAVDAVHAPWCGNADLVASYRYSDSGAGHRFGWIVLRNRSDHSCRTGGFGGLSYVGHGDGTQVGAPAARDGRSAGTFLLRPGQRVRSSVDEVRAQLYPHHRCRPVHVDGFRVYVPDATRSQYVPHPVTGCANSRVHLLGHRAYQRP